MFYDILKDAIQNYDSIVRNRNNSDYIINDENMSKLNELIRLLRTLSEIDEDIVIKPINIEPRRKSVCVEMYANGLFLRDEVINYLSDAMKLCKEVDIEALLDGRVCLTMLIVDVFVKKE